MIDHRIFQYIAPQYGLDPALVQAIAKVESSLDPWVVRFEPGWAYPWRIREFARRCNISQNTEKTLQATSWGLMQVMGTVARELGHNRMLTELVRPATNIRLGCRQIVKLLDRYQDIAMTISAYNAGSARKDENGQFMNQGYVDKVLDNMKTIENNG